MNENGHFTENKEGLVLSSHELKYGGIALIFIFFFTFAGGYFLGKKRAYDELAVKYEEECFADKVNQSLFSLYEQGDSEAAESEGSEASGEDESDADLAEPRHASQNTLEKVDDLQELAYAQLCGFGTRRMAELYVGRLQRRNIETRIIERQSRSKKGKTVTWYQVVTGTKDKRELQELIKELEKDDKLTGVQIIDVCLNENR